MPTKLQIARARARVAIAQRTGTILPDTIHKTAAMEFTEADDSRKMLSVENDTEQRAPKHRTQGDAS